MTQKKKRDDIQGLRAVAIFMVLGFHFYPEYFPNGYIGVDMFFVISGYIISMVFPKEINFKNVAEFYFRRIRRILPLYFSTILLVLLGVVVFAPENYVDVNMESGKRAILLITNIANAQSMELVYEQLIKNAEDLFTHCWSLCLELQWYLIAPLVLLWTSKKLIVCQVGLVVSLLHFVTTDANTAFNCVFGRLWQFFAGIIAHEIFVNRDPATEEDASIPLIKEDSPRVASPLPLILTGLNLLILCFGFSPDAQSQTEFRCLITFATACILMSGSQFEIPIISNSVLSWIGNISYALYLVHWPIYIAAKNIDLPQSLLLGMILSFLLATVIYYFFEKFYLTWEKPTVIVFVLFVFGASLAVSFAGKRPELSVEDLIVSQPDSNSTDDFTMNIAAGGLKNTSNNLGSPLCKYERLFDFPAKRPLGHCQMPNGTGKYNILVLGNSWASNQGPTMVYPAFKKFARKFDVFSVNGCEPLKRNKFCMKYPDYAKLAADYFKPDILFLLQRTNTGNDVHVPLNTTIPIEEDPVFKEYLSHLRYYEKYAKKIYIQQALPWCKTACTSAVVLEMKKRHKLLRDIGDGNIIHNEGDTRIRIAELGKRCKNCEIIDFLPYYSIGNNGRRVPYDLENNLILLDDTVHLNRFGKELIQPLFDQLAHKLELL